MKYDVLYAPFKFELTDLIQSKPVHKGQDGMVVAYKDATEAHDVRDKLKNTHGAQLSAYGCGPELNQHIYAPTCTGILVLHVPKNMFPENKQVISVESQWINCCDFRIEGDIAHGPVINMQITNGDAPDYEQLRAFVQYRLDDLSKITARIAQDTEQQRMQADLNYEYARDSLHDMYCTTGFVNKRVPFRDEMTVEAKAMSYGLEQLQQYMRSMDVHLPISAIITHAHSMEKEFKDAFTEYYAQSSNGRIAAAQTIAHVMQMHADKTTSPDERIAFLSFKADAERNAAVYQNLPEDSAPAEPEVPTQDER